MIINREKFGMSFVIYGTEARNKNKKKEECMALLTRYEPKTLTNWFNDFWSDEFWSRPRDLSSTFPSVEVREEKDHFRLLAEMPGLAKEDVKIEVNDGVLTLKGEKKHEKHEQEKGYYYSERSYGSFERSFNLGAHVDENDIKASFKEGVLELKIKKTEKPEAR
ncbi:MAG: hypothetical protein A2487_21270, partial [Candidatus Raymondbacteria bacterium RifOxyC12_full_50_8]